MRRLACVVVVVAWSRVASAGTAPLIVSTGSSFAVLGQPYHYNGMDQAVAVGDGPITWGATAPAGFNIDASTGAISWTPTAAGDVLVALTATNAFGFDAPPAFMVHVAAPPAITSTATLSAQVGAPYLYGSDGSIRATGDPSLVYSVLAAPPGFVVDAQSGKVSFTPETAGSSTVTLQVQNPFGSAMQSFTLTVAASGGVPPTLVRDANLSAAVGTPYIYDSSRALSVSAGDAPIHYSKTSGPDELKVDPTSGAIAWLPTTAGSQSITVRASNLAGSDDYAFMVNVASGVTAQPTAAVQASPLSGDVPLTVSFSSDGSQAGGDTTLISTEWDFGDGSPPDHSASPSHAYLLAGSYVARLTVTNSFGASATSSVLVTATINGQAPPRAQATANVTDGADLLAVDFGCDCQAGSNPIASYRWDFGDGSQSSLENPTHTFLPGGYQVHLVVSDTAGLSAEDSLSISVKSGTHLPPLVRAYAAPPSGPPPLQISLLATVVDLDGDIESLTWDFGDGTQASATDRLVKTFADAGTHVISLRALSSTGLSATDQVTITVVSGDVLPPEILSVPTTLAFVGVPYHYNDAGLPSARGGRPITWSAGDPVPKGLQVHRDTGEILWTPTADQIGPVSIVLIATNQSSSAQQSFTVSVHPASEAPKSGGCEIGGPVAAPTLLLFGLCFFFATRAGVALRRRRP